MSYRHNRQHKIARRFRLTQPNKHQHSHLRTFMPVITKPSGQDVLADVRDIFIYLLNRREQSRPIIGKSDQRDPRDRRRKLPLYGAPTFRNVIDKDGVLR